MDAEGIRQKIPTSHRGTGRAVHRILAEPPKSHRQAPTHSYHPRNHYRRGVR